MSLCFFYRMKTHVTATLISDEAPIWWLNETVDVRGYKKTLKSIETHRAGLMFRAILELESA